MLRWLIGGGREPQGLAEKSPLQTIGEEQSQNPYTELIVLKAHHDIVRFLVQLDDYRFASAGDDGIVVVWNAQTGEKLLELSGHTQKITAIIPFPSLESCEEKNQLILTASADRTVIVWDCDAGRQVQRISSFQSTVKCLTVLQRLDIWLSGGNDLCVWNREFDLLCKTSHLSDTGISALIEIPKNCVVAAIGKELIIFRLVAPTEESLEWDILEVKRLLDHQDNILSLVNVNDLSLVTGSHVGELIIWDILDWTVQAYERTYWDPSLQLDTQQEIKLCQKSNDISIHHFTCDEEVIFIIGDQSTNRTGFSRASGLRQTKEKGWAIYFQDSANGNPVNHDRTLLDVVLEADHLGWKAPCSPSCNNGLKHPENHDSGYGSC